MPNSERANVQLHSSRTVARRSRIRWRSVRGYLVLPHFLAVLLVELATVAFAIIAWGGMPPARLLISMVLAMLGGQIVIGAINDIVDFPDDVVHKPAKPIPSGDVTLRGARVTTAAGAGLLVGFGLPLGWVSFALLALGTSLGVAYDLRFKRTRWSWLPYLLALPLLPIWVFVTMGRLEPRLLMLYPLGALATAGVHLAQALPDVDADRAAGLNTPTSHLGARPVFVLAWVTATSAPLLGWVAMWSMGIATTSNAIPAAMGTTVALAAINGGIAILNDGAAYRACFPLVAISALVNGMAWVMTSAR